MGGCSLVPGSGTAGNFCSGAPKICSTLAMLMPRTGRFGPDISLAGVAAVLAVGAAVVLAAAAAEALVAADTLLVADAVVTGAAVAVAGAIVVAGAGAAAVCAAGRVLAASGSARIAWVSVAAAGAAAAGFATAAGAAGFTPRCAQAVRPNVARLIAARRFKLWRRCIGRSPRGIACNYSTSK